MASELASGYISLSVKLAKGGMADVTKEVKKAGQEGGTVYSDEFNKKVGTEVGKKLPDVIGKSTKSSGGGLAQAAKEAASEFGKGVLEGIEKELKSSGGIEKSLEGLNDKVRNTTALIQDIGGGVGIDTSGITNAVGQITTAFDGINNSVDNTKNALKDFKSGDVAGGLSALSDAFKGLENIGVPKDLAATLGKASDKAAEAGASVREITDPLEELVKGTKFEALVKKGGFFAEIASTLVAAEAQISTLPFMKGDPIGEVLKNLGRDLGLIDPEALPKITIGTKLDTTFAEAEVEKFVVGASATPITPKVDPDTEGADAKLKGWFAEAEKWSIGKSLTIPVKVDPNAPLFGPAVTAPTTTSTGGRPGGRAGGDNLVRGPGGTDNVLSWLTAGEGVVKKSAMQGGGAAIVAALNRQGGIPGFSGGGTVGPDVLAAMNLIGTPYSQDARNDCSGMVAQIINAALGLSGTGLMSTKSAESWLAARGFVSGTGGPGMISVGWYDHGGGPNDGHMAMTLSDGTSAEAGGSHSSFLVGAGAQGANSPQFDHHMYLPTLFGEGAAGSSSVPNASGAGGGGGGAGGGGLSDNPMMALQQLAGQQQQLDAQKGEQIRKILPDFGQLADIGIGGLKETLLPPGFSDPTQWKSTKSIGALLQYIGGISGDPTANGILGAVGQGITGNGSGAYQSILGAIPQPYGTLAPEQFPNAAPGVGVGAPPGPLPGAPSPGDPFGGGNINIQNFNEPVQGLMDKKGWQDKIDSIPHLASQRNVF